MVKEWNRPSVGVGFVLGVVAAIAAMRYAPVEGDLLAFVIAMSAGLLGGAVVLLAIRTRTDASHGGGQPSDRGARGTPKGLLIALFLANAAVCVVLALVTGLTVPLLAVAGLSAVSALVVQVARKA